MSAYPLPSRPTTCLSGRRTEVLRLDRHEAEHDPGNDVFPAGQRGRITAWCWTCGEVLEVQSEADGAMLYSGLPHSGAGRLSVDDLQEEVRVLILPAQDKHRVEMFELRDGRFSQLCDARSRPRRPPSLAAARTLASGLCAGFRPETATTGTGRVGRVRA